MRFLAGRWWWSPSVAFEGGRGDRYRLEQVVATARAFLAIALVAALYFDPSFELGGVIEPLQLRHLLLLGYVVYSLVVLVLVDVNGQVGRGFSVAVHVVDLLWASAGTIFTEGTASPFFVFFFFVMLAAAYRWGFWETLATTGAAIGVLLLEAEVATRGLAPGPDAFDVERLAVRVAQLLIVGVLLGYLGEEDKLLRFESAGAADLIANVKSERGLKRCLEVVAGGVLRMFSAREFLLVAAERGTGGVFGVSARFSRETDALEYRAYEVPFDQRAVYLGNLPPAWAVTARHGRGRWTSPDMAALDESGRRLRDHGPAPEAFLAAHPCDAALSVAFSFDDQWRGRVFLLDPPPGAAREHGLRFLRRLIRQVGPAVYGVYLFRRLRNRAGAVERARVARELHDGVIQSLIGVEMRLDVLRRQTSSHATDGQAEVARLQQVVHEEVLNLRDLMQQMRPPEVGPHELLSHLAEQVDRFRRDSGIAASFVTDLHELPLMPQARREFVRILQEALVNVRKHSGARHVVVRVEAHAGGFRLVVDDDGCGFDFEGRRTREELDGARRGPVILKERVRAIGGDMSIESAPGRGSRLEVAIPRSSWSRD
jgi:signal transduction histidine kinase